MGRSPRSVLIVDDDPDLRLCLRSLLEEEGYQVLEAADGDAALAACDQEPTLVLVDFHLPGTLTGSALVTALRGCLGPRAWILLLTGDESLRSRVTELGADGLIEKPFDLPDLLHLVEQHGA